MQRSKVPEKEKKMFKKKVTACLLAGFLLLAPAVSLRAAEPGMPVVTAEEATPGASIRDMFGHEDGLHDNNTWLFLGGRDVAPDYQATGGARNFIGHFEEYIRGTKYDNNGVDSLNGRQRYTINMGRPGQNMQQVAENFEELVEAYDPKAAVYLVSQEDAQLAEAVFCESLVSFIDQALALRDNHGFAVIQKPFYVQEENMTWSIPEVSPIIDTTIEETYADQPDLYGRILVIDHDIQTSAQSNASWLTDMLHADGSLNQKGHLELAKQLAEATYGGTGSNWPSKRPGMLLKLTEAEQPTEYLTEIQPQITAAEDGLQVSIPEEDSISGVQAWSYELDVEGTVLKGEADSSDFVIEHLPAGREYILKLRSTDGDIQLCTMQGSLESEDPAAPAAQVPDERQKRLTEKLQDTESLTWLFMGDSITHGLQWTDGYDSYSQLFEKYLKHDMGRPQDAVINTGVSSANTLTTWNDITFRMEKYAADVVVMMLGTNDAAYIQNLNDIPLAQYKENMQKIFDKVKQANPEAVIVCLEPIYTWHSMYNRTPNLPIYLEGLREVVEENPDVIFVEQYRQGNDLFHDYSWTKVTNTSRLDVLYPDALHPNAMGHILMFENLLKGTGLWSEDSPLTNLWYSNLSVQDATDERIPSSIDSSTAGTISLSIADLERESSRSFGDVTLKATNNSGQSYQRKAGKRDGMVSLQGLPAGTYTVEVSGILSNEAKRITFAPVEGVQVTDGSLQETDDLSVEGRYSSNHIRFADAAGAAGYYIRRSETADGDFTRIHAQPIPDVWGTREYSYIDETAGTGTQYYYKVEIITETGSELTEAVCDQYPTGIEAVQKHAEEQFHKDFKNTTGGYRFTGRMETGTSQQAAVLSSLRKGSIFITFKPDNVSGRKVLLALKDQAKTTALSNDNPSKNNVAIFQDGNTIRADFGNSMKANLGMTLAAGTWGTFGFSNFDYFQSTNNVVSVFNGNIHSVWSSATLSGFFSAAGVMDTLSVGAVSNGGSQVLPFAGEMAYVTVTDEIFSEEELRAYTRAVTNQITGTKDSSLPTLMADSTAADNSWVFTGGVAVEGQFEHLRGVRGYIGQFEEGIRKWVSGRNENQMQRYTINAGAEGRSIREVVEGYESLVAGIDPRVVVYLVGREDYQKGEAGLERFRQDLKTFIDLTLALREDGTSYAVIQQPFAASEDSDNEIIAKYAEAVNEVAFQYGDRVAIVPHFTQTNASETFKQQMLVETGIPNALGHHELGKQLTLAVTGSTANYPASALTKTREEAAAPAVFSQVLPDVSAGTDALYVTTPPGLGTAWTYEVTTEVMTVTGTMVGTSFEIPGLPAGQSYTLQLTGTENGVRLASVSGILEAGDRASAVDPEKTSIQQKLADLLENRGREGIRWLFMGDSITHGAIATGGYDSLPQLFDKYVKGELGRTNDLVINTAVYATDTKRTLNNITQRMEKYEPDVVALMLGTNDAKPSLNINIDQYETNIKSMIQKIRDINPDAIIILRSLIHTWDNNHKANVPAYTERMESIARADGNILFIDQYTWTSSYMEKYPWLKTTGGDYIYFDALHPDANGQLLLFRQLIQEMGLWQADTAMGSLEYTMPIENVQANTVSVPVTAKDGCSIVLSAEALAGLAQSQDLGAIELRAYHTAGERSYRIQRELDSETLSEDLVLTPLPEGEYQVSASGWKKSEAKKLNFSAHIVEIGETTDTEQTPAPIFSHSDGDYEEILEVALSVPDQEDAVIYYTTDGSEPDLSSAVYEDPITVDQTMTIKAFAVKEGLLPSDIVTAEYRILLPEDPENPKDPVDPENPDDPKDPDDPENPDGPKDPVDPEKQEKPWIFTDVHQNGQWKHLAVKYVYQNDIMGPVTNTTLFQPDRTLERGMFATVLWRMAGEPDTAYSAVFSDVEDGRWYSKAIVWANKQGIVQGLGNGTFGTTGNITREQIAKMLYLYAKDVCKYDVSRKQSLASFTDADKVSPWAVEYMEWATAMGIISGKPVNAERTAFYLDGKGDATRAECAAMLSRFAAYYEAQ